MWVLDLLQSQLCFKARREQVLPSRSQPAALFCETCTVLLVTTRSSLRFGQWLSMRPDMFPPDVIVVLSKLRADAPAHSGALSPRLGHFRSSQSLCLVGKSRQGSVSTDVERSLGKGPRLGFMHAPIHFLYSSESAVRMWRSFSMSLRPFGF